MKINEIIPRRTIAAESTGDGNGMLAAQAQVYKAGTPKKRRAKSKIEALQSGSGGGPLNGKLSPD